MVKSPFWMVKPSLMVDVPLGPWRWWNHGASTLGQATGLDTFVLYFNSLAINGKIYIHQLKNKIFGRYQPDSPWFIMVFLWFSHGFPMVSWAHWPPWPGAAPGDYSVLHQDVPRCFAPSLASPERPLQYSAAKRTLGKWGGTAFFRMGWPYNVRPPLDSVKLVYNSNNYALWYL